MNPARRLGLRGGWPWDAPKLLISPDYYSWMCLQGPIKDPILIKSCNVISNSQSIYHMSNFPNNDQHSPNYSLSPSKMIRPYHIKKRYQCMINRWAAN